MARCQEVISSPSDVCKQTFLMHAMKSWSYFSDQFCTHGKRNLITCLISRARRQACTNAGNRHPTCRGGSSGSLLGHFFTRLQQIVCLHQFLRINKIFKFSFLKSIKKAQSIIERQQEMNITVTQTFTERLQ